MAERRLSGIDGPWVEVSLDAALENLRAIRSHATDRVGVIAVVKDSAYGCGAVRLARAYEEAGVEWLAVARLCEARSLRGAGIGLPVLVLGPVAPDNVPWAVDNDVDIALNDCQTLDTWLAAGRPVRCHVNVNTGMGRLGFTPDEAVDVLKRIAAGCVEASGVFTHFPCADIPGTDSVATQVAQFSTVLERARGLGLSPSLVHCANSAGLAYHALPDMTTHVRAGIALYGCAPDPQRSYPIALRPVAALKGHLVKVSNVKAGTGISYGWEYHADRDTHIGTVNIGYGHGLPRYLSNRGSMLIGGSRFPIAGRVTMDFTMVDLGPDADVQPGDEVVAIGVQGEQRITPDDVARMGDTIGYEVLCGLSTRVTRVYTQGGVEVGRLEAGSY